MRGNLVRAPRAPAAARTSSPSRRLAGRPTMAVGLGGLSGGARRWQSSWIGSVLLFDCPVQPFSGGRVPARSLSSNYHPSDWSICGFSAAAISVCGEGGFVNVVLGMGLYGCTYILPVYLGQIQGYDAYQIGKTVMWIGNAATIHHSAGAAVHEARRLTPSHCIRCRNVSSSCLMMTHMSALTGYDQFRWPQIVRAIGQPFIIIPLSAAATAGIAAGKESGSASALF